MNPRLPFAACAILLACVPALPAEQKAEKVPYEVHTGYFVSNKSGLDDKVSYLAVTDEATFDKLFGKAVVQGRKEKFLPRSAFDTKLVVAVVKRGNQVWKYDVRGVTAKDGTLTVDYKATASDGGSATFASPLIVSVSKGKYTSVEFVENGTKAGTASVK
jgi:hypothetical protein